MSKLTTLLNDSISPTPWSNSSISVADVDTESFRTSALVPSTNAADRSSIPFLAMAEVWHQSGQWLAD